MIHYKIIFKGINCHFNFMALVILNFETALTEWKMYGINNEAQFTFCNLQKLVFVNILNAYGSHLDFPEHIFMTASYRLVSSLEVIKGKKMCS